MNLAGVYGSCGARGKSFYLRQYFYVVFSRHDFFVRAAIEDGVRAPEGETDQQFDSILHAKMCAGAISISVEGGWRNRELPGDLFFAEALKHQHHHPLLLGWKLKGGHCYLFI